MVALRGRWRGGGETGMAAPRRPSAEGPLPQRRFGRILRSSTSPTLSSAGIYVLYGALAAHQHAKNAPVLPETPPVKPQGMGLSPAGSGMPDEGVSQQAY